MSKKDDVRKHLETYGSITPLEAMQYYGVYRLGARIHELRKEGFNIVTDIEPKENSRGERISYAKYIMKKREELDGISSND